MDNKDEKNLKNRILELAGNCYFREVSTNTLFLNLYEQTVFHSIIDSLPNIKYTSFGGYDLAERKIVCFIPYYQEKFDFKMLSILKIKPFNDKFSQELAHRDFLGAILNLGIERNNIGDIIIHDNIAYIIIIKRIEKIIKENLEFVKKTKIKIEDYDIEKLVYINNSKEIYININSIRLDVCIAAIFNKSRSIVARLISSGLVFINGKQSTNHSYNLKENDIISVRGFGRFKFINVERKTGKGRLLTKIAIFT